MTVFNLIRFRHAHSCSLLYATSPVVTDSASETRMRSTATRSKTNSFQPCRLRLARACEKRTTRQRRVETYRRAARCGLRASHLPSREAKASRKSSRQSARLPMADGVADFASVGDDSRRQDVWPAAGRLRLALRPHSTIVGRSIVRSYDRTHSPRGSGLRLTQRREVPAAG